MIVSAEMKQVLAKEVNVGQISIAAKKRSEGLSSTMSARLGRRCFRLLASDSVGRCYVEQKTQCDGCCECSKLMQKQN